MTSPRRWARCWTPGSTTSAGTRCPTGPATRRPGAGTTCSTGPAANGGASARARTATWAGSAGGTSSTRARTRRGCARAREVLTPDERHTEDVMLRLRLASGLPLAALDDAGRVAAGAAVVDGLLDAGAHRGGRAVLTLRGRLLADAVVRDLLP